DMTAWKQGDQGNCASIATIKASMEAYGNQVFDSVSPNRSGGYDIAMQDGVKIGLSGKEMDQAAKSADFKGDGGAAQSMATLEYAAIGKRAQMANGGSYQQNLNSLNNGYDPNKVADYLGLGGKKQAVSASNPGNKDAVVAWSPQHAVFVDKEAGGKHFTDVYGSKQGFNGTDGFGHNLTNAFSLQPRSYPSQQYTTAAKPPTQTHQASTQTHRTATQTTRPAA
ncbi:MAG: hypothetical protein EB084_22245, partial [Proteobacteria bacterium]|nr:hypothetical protein [Pseudomonadota bacterium]